MTFGGTSAITTDHRFGWSGDVLIQMIDGFSRYRVGDDDWSEWIADPIDAD